MASSYSTNSKLELITTGEKAGLWGTITNTNLQILEQLSTGYLSLAVGSGDVALALDQGATSDGKNNYFKLTGTLTANRIVTMPDSAERIFVVEDTTSRTTSNFTLTVKTVSGTGVSIPVGSTCLLYSDGTNVHLGLIKKGYYSITDTSSPYTAVNHDQIMANTSANPITITLPISPATGEEVTIIDARGTFGSNNLTVARNGENINGAASNLVLNTNGQAVTLVYIDSTRGWSYKTNTA